MRLKRLILISGLGTILFVGGLTVIAETVVRVRFPQDKIYTVEYRADGLVFNRPNFDGFLSADPLETAEPLRRYFPSFFARPHNTFGKRDLPEERHYFVHTNSLGERDERLHSPSKEPGKFRVLGLGACGAFGMFANVENTFLRQLEKMDPRIETINCGMSGASPGEIYGIYEKACSNYQADVAVVDFTFGKGALKRSEWLGPDTEIIRFLYQQLGNEAEKYLQLTEDGLLKLNQDKLSPELRERFRHYFEPKLPFYDQLQLVRLIENIHSSYIEPLPNTAGVLPSTARIMGMPDQADWPKLAMQSSLKYVEKLQQSLKAKGIPMLVVVVPEGKLFVENSENDLKTLATFEEELRARGIQVLTLFKQTPDKIQVANLFLPYLGRLSTEGHKWLAEKVHAELSIGSPQTANAPSSGITPAAAGSSDSWSIQGWAKYDDFESIPCGVDPCTHQRKTCSATAELATVKANSSLTLRLDGERQSVVAAFGEKDFYSKPVLVAKGWHQFVIEKSAGVDTLNFYFDGAFAGDSAIPHLESSLRGGSLKVNEPTSGISGIRGLQLQKLSFSENAPSLEEIQNRYRQERQSVEAASNPH